jgi:hypothetical protein
MTVAWLLTRASAAEPATQPVPSKPAGLFQETTVWTVHLKFTAQQWNAMEPKSGPFGGFGGPRGPGGPGSFGPGTPLASAMLQRGDQNQDAKLSRDEFIGVGETWFAAWDKDQSGQLNADQVRLGLNAVLVPPRPRSFLQGPEGKRNGLASAMGIDFEYVHADLEFEGKTFNDVAVRYKGNGTFIESRGSIKRSFKVDLNRFVKGRKLAGITQLNLHSNWTDPSWMNEVLSHRLHRDAGIPAPRAAYARVYITVPGKYERHYFGLYSLVEDISKAFAEERFGTSKGALFKPVTPNIFTDLGDDWADYNQTYDPADGASPQDKQRLLEFCKFVSHASDADFAARLGDYIDLDEFARYMAVVVFLSDLDGILGPGQNMFLFLDPKTRKLVFIPWDQDHSFGHFSMVGTQDQRDTLSIHRPWRGENLFLAAVFRVEAFKKLYLAKMEEFSRTLFKSERFHQQVDTIAAAIRPAIQEESENKLGAFDRMAAGKPVGSGGLADFFQQPMKPIKSFVVVRLQSVLDQLAGKTQGQTFGDMGFGGPERRGDRGGPGGFGPGNFFAPVFTNALDSNRDGLLTREEFHQGFTRWFEGWDIDKTGTLTEEQLRTGVNKDLAPPRGGPGRMPGGFGPPPGGPPPRP